jgi:hypothetical protein
MHEFSWSGDVAGDFTYSSPPILSHHDFLRLSNSHALLIVKDRKRAEQAIAAGRIPPSVERTKAGYLCNPLMFLHNSIS